MKMPNYLKELGKKILTFSILKAAEEQGLMQLIIRLDNIVPDISKQRSHSLITGDYEKIKARSQHAFQMKLFEKAIRSIGEKKLTVVDIGDSAGTHLRYIKALCRDLEIRTISVDIDERAVEKIRAKGMEAIHCAAEDLNLGNTEINLFTTFEMVEHLIAPTIFFRRMALNGNSELMLATVPYLKQSRVGINFFRKNLRVVNQKTNRSYLSKKIFPEQLHIYELSPEDWKKIMLLCGWRPTHEEIYFQYPKRNLLFFLKYIWRRYDFEGFWGVILKRDLSVSDRYMGWSE